MKFRKMCALMVFAMTLAGCTDTPPPDPVESAALSTDFLILDNTVYSADGKTLYRYDGGAEFVLPDSVLYIAPNAFRGSEITDIQFNNNLIYIGCYAFYGTGITRIDLPDSVQLIDYNAFVDCLSADEGYIPAGCHSIYGFRPHNCVSDALHVAPFYREKHKDSDFPCEVVLSDDCIFMQSERDFSLVRSPGSAEDAPADWEERYFATPALADLSYNCDFQMIDAGTGVLIFPSWLNKTTVFLSRDGGVTWEETPAAPPAGTGIRFQYAGSIWPDEQTGLLYFYNVIAERFTCDPDEQLVQITTDGGKSWQTLYRRDFPSENFHDEIFGGGYFSAPYHTVAFSRNGKNLIIGFETDEKGLCMWMSSDGGSSWRECAGKG